MTTGHTITLGSVRIIIIIILHRIMIDRCIR